MKSAIFRTLEQLEEIYMDGCTDEVSGNVEAPTGHFYRVGNQIVVTDSQGFNNVENFTHVEEAEVAFDERNEDFMEWDEDGEIVVGCEGCGGYVERPDTRCNNCVIDLTGDRELRLN
jgi:hypothetical protein